MSSLPDDLDALSAGAPPVADWPGLVRRTVRVRRRRRSLVSAAAALSLVAVSGIGVVYAAGDGREPSTLVVATPGPTPTPTKSEPPRLEVTLMVGDGDVLVPAGVPLEIVAVAEVHADASPVIRELRVDGESEVPDASFLCPAPEGDPPPSTTKRARRTWTRTLAPGDHQLSVEAVAGCGHVSYESVGQVQNVRAVRTEPAATPTPATAPEPTRTTAAPEPTYPPARNVVSIEITVSPARPRVGEEVTVTVVARGDKGGVRFALISFAGGKKGLQGPDFSCPPGEPVPPKPVEVRETLTHVYEEPGDDAVLVEVDSGCGYYQGSGTKRGVITVDAAEGATPSPSASPAPR